MITRKKKTADSFESWTWLLN